jgi:hypothetical protein
VHVPVNILQIVSFAYLDRLIDNSTRSLERMTPTIDINRYYLLWKGTEILINEYEQRLILYYGVDLGQVSRGAMSD